MVNGFNIGHSKISTFRGVPCQGTKSLFFIKMYQKVRMVIFTIIRRVTLIMVIGQWLMKPVNKDKTNIRTRKKRQAFFFFPKFSVFLSRPSSFSLTVFTNLFNCFLASYLFIFLAYLLGNFLCFQYLRYLYRFQAPRSLSCVSVSCKCLLYDHVFVSLGSVSIPY